MKNDGEQAPLCPLLSFWGHIHTDTDIHKQTESALMYILDGQICLQNVASQCVSQQKTIEDLFIIILYNYCTKKRKWKAIFD